MSSGSISTIEEAMAAGDVFAWPDEHAVRDHPGIPGPITYVVAVPFSVGNPDGGIRHVEPGDVLHAAEASHSGSALRRLVRQGQVVALPSDRGIVGLVQALLARLDRLENAAA
jgi:hypothetical protein